METPDNGYTSEYTRCYDWIKSLQVPPMHALVDDGPVQLTKRSDNSSEEWSLYPNMKHKRQFVHPDHFSTRHFMTLDKDKCPNDDIILIGQGQSDRLSPDTQVYTHRRNILQDLRNCLNEKSGIFNEPVLEMQHLHHPEKAPPGETTTSSRVRSSHQFPKNIFETSEKVDETAAPPQPSNSNHAVPKLELKDEGNYARKHSLGLARRDPNKSHRSSEYQQAFELPPSAALESARSARDTAEMLRKASRLHHSYTHMGVGANYPAFPNDPPVKKDAKFDALNTKELLKTLDRLSSPACSGRLYEDEKTHHPPISSRLAAPPHDHFVIPSSADEKIGKMPMTSVYNDSYNTARAGSLYEPHQLAFEQTNNSAWKATAPSSRSGRSAKLEKSSLILSEAALEELKTRRHLAKEYKKRNQDTKIWWTDDESRIFNERTRSNSVGTQSLSSKAFVDYKYAKERGKGRDQEEEVEQEDDDGKKYEEEEEKVIFSTTKASKVKTYHSPPHPSLGKSLDSRSKASNISQGRAFLLPRSGARIVPHSSASTKVNTFA